MTSLMSSLCSQCEVCMFLHRDRKPKLVWEVKEPGADDLPKQVLVIDDAWTRKEIQVGASRAKDLLENRQFSYTQSVRCERGEEGMDELQEQEALSRCSVWTHHLAEGRLAILGTPNGLKQLKVEREKLIPGDLFKNQRLGVVLCVPPLSSLDPKSEAWKVYFTKVQRLCREVGI